VGFLPEGWIERLGLRRIGARPALGALHYAFQWRRGDARSLLPALREQVEGSIILGLAPSLAAWVRPQSKGSGPCRDGLSAAPG
jgi:hypothetical protein